VSQATPDTIVLTPGEIVRDLEWNCRDALAASKADNSALAENISDRGLLNPPRVRLLDDGRYGLVHGFRRVAACEELDPNMPILCTVQEATGDEDEDELEATAANLAENIRRQKLRPFEIANKLYRLKKSRPDLTQKQIAQLAGMHPETAGRYLTIRHSASAELWELFTRYGETYPLGVNLADVAQVVTFPADEQPARWALLLRTRKTRGTGRTKGRREPRSKMLQKFAARLDELDASEDFKAGAQWAIELATGQRSWPEPATTGEPDDETEDTNHHEDRTADAALTLGG